MSSSARDRSAHYLTEYERDAIRPHVFGKFRDLLGATAKSPAMLFYLDNWQSSAAPEAPTSADADRMRASAPSSSAPARSERDPETWPGPAAVSRS